MEAFLSGEDDEGDRPGLDGVLGVDELHIVFTEFKSMLTQNAEARRIAPMEVEYVGEDNAGPHTLFSFEPDATTLFESLLPRYVATRIFSALLEASASESASRRRAMKAASDNADDLIKILTLMANRERQAQITQEISEIIGLIQHSTHAALDMVKMTHASDKLPNEISGGMKQRIGIARALAMEPKVLLMDEPFGALDALTRAHLQDELMRIVQATGSTVVMVTHDVDEAVLLSDRIVMMTNGPSATIGEVLSVDLPRPRSRVELAESTQYLHYRKAVIDFLYTRQAHVEKVA